MTVLTPDTITPGGAFPVAMASAIGETADAKIMTANERTVIASTKQAVDESLPALAVDDPNRRALLRDDDGNVPLWYENGVSFAALGPDGQKAVAAYLSPLGAIPTQIDGDSTVAPLVMDGAGNVPIWMLPDGFDCAGFSKSFIEKFRAQVQGRQYGYGRKAPVATDGRTLFQYRMKLAALDTGANVHPTVLLVGDSQLELSAFPQALANGLYNLHGKSADGWLSAHNPSSINGITRTTVGAATNYDASDGSAPTYGCGIDGKSTIPADSTWREIIDNIRCTEFTVYYYDGAGAFQFGVYNGGVVDNWQPVVCTGSNTFKSKTFTGIPDVLGRLELRTANNPAGAVMPIHGFRTGRSAVPGMIVDKCGNASATSNNLVLFKDQLANYQGMQPDIIIQALGTNNASVQSTTVPFLQDDIAMIDAYRAQWPNVGIILIAPPLCNGIKQSPLIDYRDVIYEIALSKNCEFYSNFDDWADFATMSALGAFLADGIHQSTVGATYLTRRILQLLGL